MNETQPSARHGATGRLFSQDGLNVPADITPHGDDLLLVVPEHAIEFIAGPLTLLMLESRGPAGLIRTPGAAEVVEGNLLRFVPGDAAIPVERREFLRVIAAKRVVLRDEHHEVMADALTLDISGGGIRVQLPRNIELPDRGRVFFSLFLGLSDFDDEVRGTAEIVDLRPDNEVALAFEQVEADGQERVTRFVFERPRRSPRPKRDEPSVD